MPYQAQVPEGLTGLMPGNPIFPLTCYSFFGIETRGGNKRPILSDLRESGAIEQDADIVMFIYRPEYYKLTGNEEAQMPQGLAELIIAKHRNGALKDVPLRFIEKYAKFTELDSTDYDLSGIEDEIKQTKTFQSKMNKDQDEDDLQPF